MKGFGKKITIFVICYVAINGLIYWILNAISPPGETGLWLKNLAATIVISWVIILVIYYIWAIYFYNLNYAWTDHDWEMAEAMKAKDPSIDTGEPHANPHADQTLGFPPGTVRGTLALSLMVGGLAMTIIAISMPDTLEENEFFIDNFDFLKTAFLMMIAFYFGNKSIEALQKSSQPKIISPPGTNAGGRPPSNPNAASAATDLKETLSSAGLGDQDEAKSSDENSSSPAVG